VATLLLPAISLEYIRAAWSATVAGVAVNPSDPALPVVMAFPRVGATPVTWYGAEWESDGAGNWRARCLVGPAGTVTLNPGDYDVWVKVTSDPEIPARQATDLLTIA
jgi:hypothetical protein